MTSFTRILVDIDATAAAHPAFDRAVALARQCGASLKLVDVVSVPATARPYLPGDAERMMAETRRANLGLLASRVQGVPIEVGVLSGRPAQAIIAEVVAGGFDLVVRSHARDLAVQPRALGAIDMQLFRRCPCTVWAVGPGAARVVAAVNVNPHEAEEQRLNVRIVDTARLKSGRTDRRPGLARLRRRHAAEPVQPTRCAPNPVRKRRRDMDDFVRAVQLPVNAAWSQGLKTRSPIVDLVMGWRGPASGIDHGAPTAAAAADLLAVNSADEMRAIAWRSGLLKRRRRNDMDGLRPLGPVARERTRGAPRRDA